MGLAICILFGILTALLTVLFIPKWRPENLAMILITGSIAGIFGCYIGKQLGLAGYNMFNLISTGISICLSVTIVAFMWFTNLFGWQSNLKRAGITVLDNHEKAIAEHV